MKIVRSIQLFFNIIRVIVVLTVYFAYKICKINSK